jgi:hypothetical protein
VEGETAEYAIEKNKRGRQENSRRVTANRWAFPVLLSFLGA